jgi:uncharacterized protein (DUF849 family)
MLYLQPDMASLATGSVNFPNSIYENPPSLIDELAKDMIKYSIKPEVEIFDLSMLYNAIEMAKIGLLIQPLHVQFVFGIKNALPAKKNILEFQVCELKKHLPQSTWTAAGLGKSQLEVNEWSLELGGHCRTGLEDNIKFDKSRLANGNEELVERLTSIPRIARASKGVATGLLYILEKEVSLSTSSSFPFASLLLSNLMLSSKPVLQCPPNSKDHSLTSN